VVDFSKLRLPNGDSKPGEGTEPAPGNAFDGSDERTHTHFPEESHDGAKAEGGEEAAVGGGADGPVGGEAGDGGVTSGDGANASGGTSDGASGDTSNVGGPGGGAAGTAGLRLRLPGLLQSPTAKVVSAGEQEVTEAAIAAEAKPVTVPSAPMLNLPRPVSVFSKPASEAVIESSGRESVSAPYEPEAVERTASHERSGESTVASTIENDSLISNPEYVSQSEPAISADEDRSEVAEEESEDLLSQFPEDDDTFVEEELEQEDESHSTVHDVVNPLLGDDDEDELLSAAVLAKQLGLKSGLTEFSDESEPEEDSESFTGFDDQFRSLLDDDEDELVIPSRSGRRVAPMLPAVDLLAEPEPGRSVENLPHRSPESKLTPVAPQSHNDAHAPVEQKPTPQWASVTVPARSAKSPEQLEETAGRRKADLRAKEAEQRKEQEFASDFIGDTTAIVKVNTAGETRGEAGKERKRLVKPTPGGKMKAAELDFYKTLGTVREEFSDGMVAAELITGPLAKKEDREAKKGRLEHLQRTLDSRNLYRAGTAFKLDSKTVDTLSFLALFRYATHSHIARIFGEKPLTTLRRMRKMRDAGMVTSKKLYSQHAIWFLTEAGVIVSGYDMRHITEAKLTPSMFPHQFTVNHVAANLMGGKLNVLNLPEFPVLNRRNVHGDLVMGEQLTSELEILSSFAKIKLFEQSATFRPKLLAMRDREFERWSEAPNRELVPTPELIFGNEWMFTLFPPLAVGVAYHVPDLIVKRQRGADGAPQSIAVEIEINNKPTASYEKTLRAYADDNLIFGQVIWVCKTVGPAKKLEKVGRELGMIQSGKLKIVPIWTSAGVFKGRDLWTI
jgi:hypothetical protein